MKGLMWIEPIVDLTLACLQARMVDKIAELQPRFQTLGAPALPMPAIAASGYSFGERVNPVTFPAIEVVQVRSRVVADNRFWQDWEHTVGIGVFVQGSEETLPRLIARYMACVIECLNDGRRVAQTDFTTIDGLDGPAFATGEVLDWGPARPGGRDLFERDAWLPVTFIKHDTASDQP